jgi:hypothetical protein
VQRQGIIIKANIGTPDAGLAGAREQSVEMASDV